MGQGGRRAGPAEEAGPSPQLAPTGSRSVCSRVDRRTLLRPARRGEGEANRVLREAARDGAAFQAARSGVHGYWFTGPSRALLSSCFRRQETELERRLRLCLSLTAIVHVVAAIHRFVDAVPELRYCA
jgi:hypothetical protein